MMTLTANLCLSNFFRQVNTILVKTCFWLFLLIIGSISIQGQQTLTKVVGGTVTYPDGTPASGITVVQRTGTGTTGYPNSLTYKLFITDINGYFSSTETFFCGYTSNYSKGASALRDDGTLSPGTGGGGGLSCYDNGDWSNSNSFILAKPELNNPQNAGDSCNSVGQPKQSENPQMQSVGEPVNVTNGNMWLKQTDYALPGIGENIKVIRTYNSMKQIAGIFGYGWTSQYDEKLVLFNSLYIRITLANGQIVYFGQVGGGVYTYNPLTPDFYGYVVKNADNTYDLIFKDGRVHKFNSSGKLIWKKDRTATKLL